MKKLSFFHTPFFMSVENQLLRNFYLFLYQICTKFQGLHRLQGTYPILMTSSLLPV